MDGNVSVIIPTLNEEKSVERTVQSCRRDQLPGIEVIVVDGGSDDATVAVARKLGCKVFLSIPQRSAQMNLGALHATHPWLLFLHADTQLPPSFPTHLATLQSTSHPPFKWATFQGLKFTDTQHDMRTIERGVRLRTRLLKLPYGDQALLIRREVFWQEVGGFRNLPLMEDVDMVCRLWKVGGLWLIPDVAATSARRWDKFGRALVTCINLLLVLFYFLGVDTGLLASVYYGLPKVLGKR